MNNVTRCYLTDCTMRQVTSWKLARLQLLVVVVVGLVTSVEPVSKVGDKNAVPGKHLSQFAA